jgi:flavin reductase (DIM6/NTAB) family NADH-FMN oxidoreductase RutF
MIFDTIRFREALGHFATGVAIVTAVEDSAPFGVSVNSFTSVSLDPPLVAMCAAHTSTTWPRLRSAGAFCVNILSDGHESLCRRFARSGTDRFEGLDWRPSPRTRSPILAGVAAWLDCWLDAEYLAGDHTIIVAKVLELSYDSSREPLVFFRSRYRCLDAGRTA